MKKILILLCLVTSSSFSQILTPVKWTTAVKKVSSLEYDLILEATIEPKFHLYSQSVPENGPQPTVFIFEENKDFERIGTVKEEKGHVAFDPTFEVEVKYFENKAQFKQRIKVKNNSALKIIGEIEYMTCDDRRCMMGYDDFEFQI